MFFLSSPVVMFRTLSDMTE